MKFETLAECFEKLEGTSSRLELIRILSELFGSIRKGDEIERLCYLVQGRVAPFFEPVEFGMADKGLAAYELAKKSAHECGMSVDEVFVALNELARISGIGSVERKVAFLGEELLRKLDPLSIKFVARIVLGKLRLGVGDPTILEALALGILGDRSA